MWSKVKVLNALQSAARITHFRYFAAVRLQVSRHKVCL